MHSYNTYLICNCVRTRPSLKRNVITYACTPSLVPFVFHDGIFLCVYVEMYVVNMFCGSVVWNRDCKLSDILCISCVFYIFSFKWARVYVCVCWLYQYICVYLLYDLCMYRCMSELKSIIRTSDLHLRLHAHFSVRIDETKHNIINFV